jgi:hypothetical protein
LRFGRGVAVGLRVVVATTVAVLVLVAGSMVAEGVALPVVATGVAVALLVGAALVAVAVGTRVGDGVALALGVLAHPGTARQTLSRPPVTVFPTRDGRGATLSRMALRTAAVVSAGCPARITPPQQRECQHRGSHIGSQNACFLASER